MRHDTERDGAVSAERLVLVVDLDDGRLPVPVAYVVRHVPPMS